MREKYLKILELDANASYQDIKKAYRRLSKKYHPDLNKATDSEDRFIQLNEAYDYLINPRPEAAYQTEYPRESEFELKKRKVREFYKKRQEQERIQRKEAILKLTKIFNLLVGLILAFNVLLAIDFLLPSKEISSAITRIEKVFNRRYYIYDDVYFGEYKLRLPIRQLSIEQPSIIGNLKITPIFSKVKIVEYNGLLYEPLYSIYKTFGVLIPISLLLGLLMFAIAPEKDARPFLACVIMMILFIQLLIFFRVSEG